MLQNLTAVSAPSVKRIAHFGGSFNPVHSGHLAVARNLVEKYGFERVIFTPNGSNYPKAGLAPEQDRLHLLRKAICNEHCFEICEYETGRDCLVRTLETVKYLHGELQKQYENFQLFCVRGADAVQAIRTWRSLPELCRWATILLVPRQGTDYEAMFATDKRLESLAANFQIIKGAVPEVSSTLIRRYIMLGQKHMLTKLLPKEIEQEIYRRGLYGAVAPGNHWLEITRPGISGRGKKTRDKERAQIFGHENYRTAFRWGDKILEYSQALQLYEDGYMEHFRNCPQDLQWLTATASEVFDNSESNIMSGYDYTVQEALSTHLQDIAVRRCLLRLGLKFKGDHLVEIRGQNSEGYRLNPGQVPFHLPEKIIQPELIDWWRPGSIESFWQSNKVLQVREGIFNEQNKLFIHLVFIHNQNIIGRLEQDKVKALPLIGFSEGVGLQALINKELQSWGCSMDDFIMMQGEPVYYEGDTHVAWITKVQPQNIQEGCDYFPISRVLSSVRYRPLKKLLKTVNHFIVG